MVSSENMQTNNIIWTGKIILRNIYVYTNAHMHTISSTDEKRGCEFEGEQGGVGGRLRRKERERETVGIKRQPQNKQIKINKQN